MSRFPNRRWLVIPTSITGSIDFGQVYQSSADKLRTSVDGTQTFVKYDINEVTQSYSTTSIDLETSEETTYITEAGIYGRPSIYSSSYTEYNHQDILTLLATDVWTSDEELG
jgi:hypothetical protein